MAGTRLLSLTLFALPLILVAPFAYNLTRVQRSPLPLDEIKELPSLGTRANDSLSLPLSFIAPIDVILLRDNQDKSWTCDFSSALAASVKEELQHALGSGGHHVQYKVRALEVSSATEVPCKASQGSAASLKACDEALHTLLKEEERDKAHPSHNLTFFLLCDVTPGGRESQDSPWIMGRYRHGWSLIRSKEGVLRSLKPLAQEIGSRLSPRSLSLDGLHPSLSYRFSFYILNEDPASRALNWDFSQVFKLYLSRFLSKISVLADVSVDSQVLQYGKLSAEPLARDPDNPNRSLISLEGLQTFMAANDWSIASLADDRAQHLHFMVFVPTQSQGEVLIAHQEQLLVAFQIRDWGGIYIYSKPNSTERECVLDNSEAQKVMAVFVAQLRQILGFPELSFGREAAGGAFHYLPSPYDGLADWELDVMVNLWTLKHYHSAVKTLSSIARLVEDIPQMTVLPRVSDHVTAALSALREAEKGIISSSSSKDYWHVLELLRTSLKQAELAYYDPTMVPQLYFPDEHLAAVYLPLLAPLILPFVVGFIRELRSYRKKIQKS